MTQQYFDLDLCSDIRSQDDLEITRTKELLEAIDKHSDYTIIKLMRFSADGEFEAELIIIEVECDGIPPKNAVGLLYRERLALYVPRDHEKLVQVMSVRKDFPKLMHQNQSQKDQPTSLCLYFEPASSVLRTWTPQSFIKRIQWWLEKSSKNELHPADQPVEHLFFQSKFELILPFNFEELQKNHSSFTITRGSIRQDDGFSCFLHVDPNNIKSDTRLRFFQLKLPAIVHGSVENDPNNFGDLFDLLSRRNINLITELKSALYDFVGTDGASVPPNYKGTLILLQIPICRSVDSPTEGVVYRAFFTAIDILDLGHKLDILIKHDNQYYRNLLILPDQPSVNDSEWRQHLIEAVEVLKKNDSSASREQSGVNEEGPTGVLIGVGSLGSALINLWGRSGWGTWTTIDKDHIKPHNLSRHVAYARHIGEPKVTTVSELHSQAVDNASTITGLVLDATDLLKNPAPNVLRYSTLVIDASTTLEYPRASSADGNLSRHISVFITPDGNGSVLLAEDAQRTIRLRTLEAQYYRALIQNDIGKTHLTKKIKTFWSGSGCRDISVVLPYSRIIGHASTLAEQIPQRALLADASIKIWQKEPINGSVEVFDFSAQLEKCIPLDDLNLFIDNGVEQYLFGLREQCLPNETGGVLLGYYDFNIKAVIIVSALPAPLDSIATPTSFKRGTYDLAQIVQEASERTMGMVGYIGEWHSHPNGSSTSMSQDDIAQLSYLAQGMAEDGLPAISLIIGENDFQVYKGAVK
jgi:integrative and conjugative element protein (TIGR02256 family)